MNNVIEYYLQERFGRIDYIPKEKNISLAVSLITGNKSGVMNERTIRGFLLLGFEFKKITSPTGEES